jgi:hypothetical protein
VAPAYVVEEFPHVIAMVMHPQVAFDQIGERWTHILEKKSRRLSEILGVIFLLSERSRR